MLNERFWNKVDQSGGPQACWPWTACKRNGYGLFTANATTLDAHRVAYEDRCGPIPDGLQIDHLCRNRPCVNPAHLEIVTQGENIRRGHRRTDMMVNGERVRQLRKASGLSREQLAVKAGTTGRTLARIENEEGPSNYATLRVLALALDCEVSDFTDEDPVAA